MGYTLTMTALQRDFYHALLAPFHAHELSEVPGRGTSVLTYLDKRAIENRLDTVCGPAGWYPTYAFNPSGVMICSLSILVPGPKAEQPPSTSGDWTWVAKEDGGGNEEMVKKSGGELVRDDDNSAKSLFTNSLRRAAQDAWGIGRYLYKKGVPGWLSVDNLPLEPTPVRMQNEQNKTDDDPGKLPTLGRHRDIRAGDAFASFAHHVQPGTIWPCNPRENREDIDQWAGQG